MLLNRSSSGGRWRIRPDGLGKVTGSLAYLTDMTSEQMLYGLVLRSEHPHARIVSIQTDKAKQLPGVHAVLTYLDVPGLNAFGIAHPDQPVLCEDFVRYVGDALATVAAESVAIAQHAIGLIEVEYEILQVLDDPEAALQQDAPKLHPQGNAMHRTAFSRGNPDEGFKYCAHIVEETYSTPRQMHTYMETEGGLFVPGDDGRLTVFSPTQHGFMDRMQLARILSKPQEDIRIVSSPIGGSFGGKDELNVQPYGALLAVITGKLIKMHNSRQESVRAGLKRHPMRIAMKTGVDAKGKLVAHQVRILSDTGPYSTLGAEVLNFATEHVIGPYKYVHLEVNGVSVFTNNGMSGEFRGFGGNQAIFALEGQMDRLAERLGMEPWAFRKLNMRQVEDPGPFDQPIAMTEGAEQVWRAIEKSSLWQERNALNEPKALHSEPWIKTGIGAAFTMHGAGLGVGIPDPAGGRLELAPDGKIEAVFGYEEFGQGLIATLEQMLIEQYGLGAGDIRIIIGDTDIVPDSGSTTASRATAMMWKSLQRLKKPFTEQLLTRAGVMLNRSTDELRLSDGGIRGVSEDELLLTFEELAKSGNPPIRCETSFSFPTSPTDRVGAHFMYTYSAVAVKVELNTLTGRVKVLQQYHAVAAGPVVNPQGYLGQIEGGSSMALGFTLMEDAVMEKGHYITRNLDTYLVPTIVDQQGRVEVEPIEHLPENDDYGPRGIGEVGSVTLAPAIAAAVRQASGKWVTKLPIEPSFLQEEPFFLRKG
ncbi:xanthine dehydrogenase subunit D [Paenibacillus sp. LHD-38]|uniref:xanthine dehydrogenase subunit D n=1 Tax=Paenibacillus sp. LHD-38 TaxID=3072143 RepID=UPI0028107814|nr:xanthine dehydrogenase subunit D [Paenibacillus sp. LHD-38]MDQ8735302.1 xanthine dehydrogenase subunit D [Paenibacillus sp. LHD-38]